MEKAIAAALLFFAASTFALAGEKVPDQIMTFDGLGPVRLGMAVDEAEAALKTKFKPMDPHYTEECWITDRADGVDPQISYMIQNGRVARIDADDSELGEIKKADPHVVTEKGIRIFSTEEQIKKAYGASLVKKPPSQDEQYLYVDSDDGQRTLLFEMRDNAAVNLRTGVLNAVGLTEGCN